VKDEDYLPLTYEQISQALARSSNTSAPNLDQILYSVWKSLHHMKPSLLSSLLNPLLVQVFHPPHSRKPWASS